MTRRTSSLSRALGAAFFFLALPLALAACGGVNTALREATRAESPHERYARALRDAELDRTALGRDWLAAADRSLAAATPVTLPFREAGYFAETEAAAVAYRVRARRGQRIVADAQVQAAEPARLFVDVFEPPRDSAGSAGALRAPTRLTSADSGAARVAFEAERDGDYFVRLQPELLRGVRYVLTLQATASLAFPVDGQSARAVQSRFGAARDGGRRAHQGIDIFAPRGTPVLAAAGGVANSGDNLLGGKVVWVWEPERNRSLYYAHLDSQAVRTGQLVRTGDTLGFVGNTGNARTTAPHLHFGIYRRGEGAIDPYPFVFDPPGEPPAVTADIAVLGAWRRVDGRRALALYAAPAAPTLPSAQRGPSAGPPLRELPPRTVMRVEGVAGRFYRVRLPDGTGGYVAAAGTAAADTPVARARPVRPAVIRDRPSAVAAAVDSVAPGKSVPVLGRFDAYLMVRTRSGRTGWLAED